MNEKPVEVNCFGVSEGKYMIIDKKMVFSTHYPTLEKLKKGGLFGDKNG